VAALGAIVSLFVFCRRLRRPQRRTDPLWLLCAAQDEDSGGTGGYTEASPANAPDPRVVIVSNVPQSVTWQLLKDHFRVAGPVEYTNVLASGGRAVVRYSTEAAAQRALQIMDQHPFKGVTMSVAPDDGRRSFDRSRSPTTRRSPRQPSVWYVRDENDLAADGSAKDMEFAAQTEELVNKRIELRNEQRYEEADAVRETLRSRGVTIDDRTRTWFVNRVRAWAAPTGYQRDPNDQTADGSAEDARRVEEVNGLLAERIQHRSKREWAEADAIQERLRSQGIYVNDDTRIWSASPTRSLAWRNGERRRY